MVAAVRRPGARRLHRRSARPQQERGDRGRQRRAGRGRAHDDALAALPAAQLPGHGTRQRFSELVGRSARPGVGEQPRRRPTRCSPERPGRSTCGAASGGSPRRRARSSWPPTRRAAAWCCRWPPRCLDLHPAPRPRRAARGSKRTLGTYDESVKLFELQFKYGQVSRMNVEQARSQYETAAAQIPLIENQIAQTETALSILLGRNPGPIARGKRLDALALPSVPAGLPSQLLERRPDLLQAEETLVAANAQIGAAKAQYFPTISLTGTYGTASNDLNSLFSGASRVWSYGGSIIGPIFTGGAISGQVAQAEGRAEGGARLLPARDPERVRRRRERAGLEREARRPARGPGPARNGTLRVFEARAAPVRWRLFAVLHRPAGRAAALSRRAEPGERSARSSTHRSSASTRRSAADGWTRRTSSRRSRWPAVCRRATRRAQGRRPNAEGVGAREDLARMAVTTASEFGPSGRFACFGCFG